MDNVNYPLCPHRIRKCRPDRDFGSETNAKPIWNSTSVCDSKSDLISALNSRLRLKMESYSILLMRKIAILSHYLSKKVNWFMDSTVDLDQFILSRLNKSTMIGGISRNLADKQKVVNFTWMVI